MKIQINIIQSEKGILQLHDLFKTDCKTAIGLEIYETSTKTTWVNFGGFNGNYYDLWLRKKDTFGKTKKTFKRLCVQKYADIANELRWLKIEASNELIMLVEQEAKETETELKHTQSIIENFNDVERMARWKEILQTKNSQKARTFCKNKLIKLGAKTVPTGYARQFQNKILSF